MDADALRRASKTLIEAQGEQFRRAEKAEAEVVRLRTALGRVRQGFLNILDCRRFEFGDEFRYGALHRQEVEAEIKLLDAALGGLLTPTTVDAEPR